MITHHYYAGAAKAHEKEVQELHRAAANVGRTEQWLAAVDYMKALEQRVRDLEDSLSAIIVIAERHPTVSDILTIAREARVPKKG